MGGPTRVLPRVRSKGQAILTGWLLSWGVVVCDQPEVLQGSGVRQPPQAAPTALRAESETASIAAAAASRTLGVSTFDHSATW